MRENIKLCTNEMIWFTELQYFRKIEVGGKNKAETVKC